MGDENVSGSNDELTRADVCELAKRCVKLTSALHDEGLRPRRVLEAKDPEPGTGVEAEVYVFSGESAYLWFNLPARGDGAGWCAVGPRRPGRRTEIESEEFSVDDIASAVTEAAHVWRAMLEACDDDVSSEEEREASAAYVNRLVTELPPEAPGFVDPELPSGDVEDSDG